MPPWPAWRKLGAWIRGEGDLATRQEMRPSTAAATVWLCTVAPLAAILIPLLLPFLQHAAALGPAGTGLLAAADLVGSCVPTLTAPFWLARTGSRRGAGLGLAIVVAANLPGALAHTAWLLLATRLLSGFGLGLVLSSAVPLVAASARPARLISAIQVLQLLLAAAAIQTAGWMLPWTGSQGVLLAVVAITLASCPLVFLLPDRSAAAHPLPTLQDIGPSAPILLGILVYFASLAVLTNFAGTLGLQRHIALGPVSTALALGNLGALPGSLVAMAVSHPARRSWLLVGAGLAECMAVGGMLWVPGYLAFAAGFFLIQVCVTMSAPLQVAALVDRDASGRGIEGLAAAQLLGQALGPLLGGLFITAARVDGAYVFGLVGILLSTGVIVGRPVLAARVGRR